MKPLWSKKRFERLLLLDDIERKCEKDNELNWEMISFFGEDLLKKVPLGKHWFSWNNRLPNLIGLIFNGG